MIYSARGRDVLKNQLINYILEICKQTWNFSELPSNTDIECLDAIDYFNTLQKIEPNMEKKYLSLPAVLIEKDGKKIIYVNETEITGKNRYFSLEVFLSILSSLYVETIDSVVSFSKKFIIFFKKNIVNGLDLLKSFHSNLMAFDVLDVLFADEGSPYRNIDHSVFLKEFHQNLKNKTDKKERIDCLGYLLSKIKLFSKYTSKDSLLSLSKNVNDLYNILDDTSLDDKIKCNTLYKINKICNKCIA